MQGLSQRQHWGGLKTRQNWEGRGSGLLGKRLESGHMSTLQLPPEKLYGRYSCTCDECKAVCQPENCKWIRNVWLQSLWT